MMSMPVRFASWRPQQSAGGAAMPDLIERISRSDEAAFRELYAAYGPRVKTYMMRRGVEPQAAEDLAQETMLTVWRKAALYSGEKGTPANWIFTIARNLHIDRVRRTVPFQALPEAHLEAASPDPTPEASLAGREIEIRVRAALAELPEEQRQIVTLAYIEGLSQTEIAGRLGLALGTVKSRMRLAYQKVRTALEDLK